MSFSLSVRAPTIAAALAAAAVKLDEVVVQQPTHSVDREAIGLVAAAYCDMIGKDDETTDVQINLSGSLSWRWEGDKAVAVTSAQLSCGVMRVPRAAAA